MRRHSTKWIPTCILQKFRITQGIGHGDEHSAEARQESAAAETGGGAEATGRGIGGEPARPCAPRRPCAHSALLPHPIAVRHRPRPPGSCTPPPPPPHL